MATEVSRNHVLDPFWNDFFRIGGYFPFVSSVTGMVRIGVGVATSAVNAICIPIFALAGSQERKNQAIQNLKESALWFIRGAVETKPFIGNGIVWSFDTIQERLQKHFYKQGLLSDWSYVPIISLITGGVRVARGISGVVMGIAAQVFFILKKCLITDPELEKKIAVVRTFTKESLFEIPQGVIEMIPLGHMFCPSLAELADLLEQKKIEIWRA